MQNDFLTTVFITGSNRGMGLGYVKHYLQEGAKIIATVRNKKKCHELLRLKASNPKNLILISLDISKKKSLKKLAVRLKELRADFSLVINNAGISNEKAFGIWTMKSFEDHFRVNTIGPALIAQAIVPYMRENSKLIQISSGMGSIQWNINPTNDFDAYAASKSALHSITVRLAEKLKERKITIISLNPGWVQTDMGGKDADNSVDESIENITKTIDTLNLSDSGSFISDTGDKIPW